MTRVLIVDDSALIRRLLTDILSSDPELEVVGAARDPYVARDMIKQLAPDVLTLDVEMPRMDGITFLRNLMRLHPMPVVMISTKTAEGAEAALEALAIGAVDVVGKPEVDVVATMEAYAEELIAKVKTAARARILRRPAGVAPRYSADAILPVTRPSLSPFAGRLVAIGASTGGTEALTEVIRALPANAPPVVISQHMPPGFTDRFARRLDAQSRVRVAEATDGAAIAPGHVYIAPGQRHLMVVRAGTQLVCRLNDGPPVNRHRPSVDVMFRSVANVIGPSAVGVLLTGMGDDGARGIHELREAGAPIMVQDEATSVVWGMPGSAVKLGPVEDILPLEQIAARIMDRARRARSAA